MPFEEAPKVLLTEFGGSNPNQAADDPPDHSPQEVRRFDSKLNNVVLGFDGGALHNNDGGFVRPGSICRAKANEVVASDQ